MAEAQQLLDELAQQDLAAAKAADSLSWLNLPSLALPALRALTPGAAAQCVALLVGRADLGTG